MAELVDQFGNPLKKQQLLRTEAEPNVRANRTLLSGHPAHGLTPQRLARILLDAEQGDATSYLELAEQMEEKDLHYASVLATRKRQVSQLEITVEPAGDTPQDKLAAELVDKEILKRDELADELVDILDAVGKGYSATEILWETSERQWRPSRLEWRYPQWFEYDWRDHKTLLLRADDGQLQPLTPFKFIVHEHKAKSGAPIRGGFARLVAWFFLFKNYSIKDWITFIEVFGQPIRVGKYHAGATQDEKRALLRALTDIGTDAAAMIPEGMMLEFVKAEGTSGSSGGAEIYKAFLHYADAAISKAILGQTLTTEQGENGARSLGEVHNEVRGDLERSDARQLAVTLNRDLVRPLVFLNMGEPANGYPKIRIGRSEQVDRQQLTQSLAQLVPLGLKVSAKDTREKLGLAEPESDDDVLQGPQPAAPPQFASRRQERLQHGRSRAQATTAAQDPERPREDAEAIADQVDAELGNMQDATIDQVREIVEESASLEEARERILQLYPEMGGQQAMADKLREAMVLAELVGRDDADPGDGPEDSGES